MKNFKDGGFRKGGSDFKKRSTDFGGKSRFTGKRMETGFRGSPERSEQDAGRSFGTPALFPATCSTCRKSCEVPFKPSSDKPVYCSACFGKKNQDEGREFRTTQKDDNRAFKREIPKQREDRSRFEVIPKNEDGDLLEIKRQLSSLEGKMNRVLDVLNAQVNMFDLEAQVVPPVIAEAPKKVVKSKIEKKSVTKKIPKKAVKAVKPKVQKKK